MLEKPCGRAATLTFYHAFALEIQGIGPDLQTPALTYDGKYVLTPFSGFQRLSSGMAVIETATDSLIGILPEQSYGGIWVTR